MWKWGFSVWELNQEDLWFGDEIKRCLHAKMRWKSVCLRSNNNSWTSNLHSKIWQMVLDSRNMNMKNILKYKKSVIYSALFGHVIFHTWKLHSLKTSVICLKPPDFSQLNYLHCSCTGLKPTPASSALGFLSEKTVIYSSGTSYFCLWFLRLKHVCKNRTVARQWVHHCVMSLTYHARAKAKVSVTLVITLCSARGHINPLFIHKHDKSVDGCGCFSILLTSIPEADGLEFSMWHKLAHSHR